MTDEDHFDADDIESDDDEGSCTSANDRNGSQADRRAHHNALERKRRDHIKDSFTSLRDSVPSLQSEKASRAQILKKAAEYIQMMRRKNTSHQQDIDDLKKQNKVLEEQIRTLDKTSRTIGGGNVNGSAVIENIKSESVSSMDGMSDSSDTEGLTIKEEGFEPPNAKRLKGSSAGRPSPLSSH